MGATGRMFWGIVVGVCLLGLAVLEVVSERVRGDPAITTESPAYLTDSAGRIAVLGSSWQKGESPER